MRNAVVGCGLKDRPSRWKTLSEIVPPLSPALQSGPGEDRADEGTPLRAQSGGAGLWASAQAPGLWWTGQEPQALHGRAAPGHRRATCFTDTTDLVLTAGHMLWATWPLSRDRHRVLETRSPDPSV